MTKSIIATAATAISRLNKAMFSRKPMRTQSSNHRLPREQQDQIMAAAAEKRARRAARNR